MIAETRSSERETIKFSDLPECSHVHECYILTLSISTATPEIMFSNLIGMNNYLTCTTTEPEQSVFGQIKLIVRVVGIPRHAFNS